jgi:hypothetical protein
MVWVTKGATMSSSRLRGTRRKVASTLEDAIEKIEEAAGALGEEADKAGDEVRAELAALPGQLEGLRRAMVAAVEPHRPPKQYRPYVQFGVLVMVVAAVIALVVRGRRGADRSAGTAPDRAEYQRGSAEDGQTRPISAAHAAKPEHEGPQG